MQVDEVGRFRCDYSTDECDGFEAEPAGAEWVELRGAVDAGVVPVPRTREYDVVVVGAGASDVVTHGNHHAAAEDVADVQHFPSVRGVQACSPTLPGEIG